MKVLVVVDMQNDFITGSLGTPEARAIVPKVKAKIEEYVRNDGFIFYTRDSHWRNYLNSREGRKLPVEHCIFWTNGWKIPDELYPPADYTNYKVLNKFAFGSNLLPARIARLRRVDEIELVGLCTDICVVSNALLLKTFFHEEVDISVDANCCAGVTPETHEAALKVMEMCQINVKRDAQ